MTHENITSHIMNDGSRHFLSLPQTIYPEDLADRIAKMPDVTVTDKIYSHIGSWIDFTYQNRSFSINDQFGEYWFFVSDPQCPPAILTELRGRFVRILK